MKTILEVPARSGWREIKTGDCVERGETNKFRIHGFAKEPIRVKWNVYWNSAYSEGINIDPYWLGAESVDLVLSGRLENICGICDEKNETCLVKCEDATIYFYEHKYVSNASKV